MPNEKFAHYGWDCADMIGSGCVWDDDNIGFGMEC